MLAARDRCQIKREKEREEFARKDRRDRQRPEPVGPIRQAQRQAPDPQPQVHAQGRADRAHPGKEHRLQPLVHDLDHHLVEREEQRQPRQGHRAKGVDLILAVHPPAVTRHARAVKL